MLNIRNQILGIRIAAPSLTSSKLDSNRSEVIR